jgi:putative flippase GtrA
MRPGGFSPSAKWRQFLAFFGGSAIGLSVDLGLFAGLYAVGAQPGVANAASATVSITVVYFLIVRYSFVASATWRTYVAFVAWYAGSITLVSVMIGLMSAVTSVDGFWWKAYSIPFSFLANYAFSRVLFRPREGGTEHG